MINPKRLKDIRQAIESQPRYVPGESLVIELVDEIERCHSAIGAAKNLRDKLEAANQAPDLHCSWHLFVGAMDALGPPK